MQANKGWVAFGYAAIGCAALGAALAVAAPIGPGAPEDLVELVTPKDNPTTDAKVALGKKLYEDTRLSSDNTVACKTCHDPDKGFTDRLPTSKGVGGQTGKRNAPTVLSALFLDTQFLDGRAPNLEAQAKLPILNPIEMGMKSPEEVVAKLKGIPEYVDAFQKVFGREINYDDLGRAIAAFERTVLSSDAPIDRFLAGDDKALTPAQRRGWSLFNGKARCNTCHGFNASYPLFSDNKFHNIGIAARNKNFSDMALRAEKIVRAGDLDQIDELALNSEFSDLGRFLVTQNKAQIGAFKTNHLRDIALTSPYMHNGELKTLWDVVDHYNKGGIPNPFLDGGIQRLGLSEDQISDLVELLGGAFTSSRFAADGKAELERQRKLAASNRPERDTDAAMGKTMGRGDAPLDPDLSQKDPAFIGGRAPKY
ncbi:MAG: cytochrome-c peroxidase [Acidobacteria bacterium]|nr:cytochrome-c peroxidase [Acidobacteriota bacterium]